VIIAGGAGERLRPLTNSIPKALATVDGVPMLRHQVFQLQELGVSEVVVLTGYRSDMIQAYVEGAFSESKINIACIASPADYSPAERILESKSVLGNNFLLLYCDNLISDLDAIRNVIKSTNSLTFLLEKRKVGNVSIDPSVRYSPTRTAEHPYVELGYLHINTNSFFKVLEKLNSLPETLQEISKNHTCAAYVTRSALKSTSTIERFTALRSSRAAILLDRDGILNHSMPPRRYVSKLQEYAPHVENITPIATQLSSNTDFIIITNQPGISTGEVSPDFLDKLHSKMIVELLLIGVSVVGLYFCPHHWDDHCECRKPKPGMLIQATSDYALDCERILYIGDELKDLEAANSAGIAGVRIANSEGEHTYSSIRDAIFYIEAILGR
jgi:D-glycero-D-manno-heptose 1,7-bisphosphate phosphatase